ARAEDDDGLHGMRALGIGAAHHGAVRDRGMLHQAVLDLRRTDAVARALEHVVAAALVPEIAVPIALRKIPGAAPFAGVFPSGRLGIPPVFEKEHRIVLVPGGHLSSLTGRDFVAALVDAGHAVSGVRPADRPGLGRPQGMRISDDVVDLGLAEHLVDGNPERLAAPLEYRL